MLGTPSIPPAAPGANGTKRGAVLPPPPVSGRASVSQADAEFSRSGVRMQMVSEVRQALASGTYRVAAYMVAGRVLESMLMGGVGWLR